MKKIVSFIIAITVVLAYNNIGNSYTKDIVQAGSTGATDSDVGYSIAFNPPVLTVGTVNAGVQATNNGSMPKMVTPVAAIFTSGMLQKIKIGTPVTVNAGADNNASINLPIDVDAGIDIRHSVLKVFLWDDLNNIQPVGKASALYPDQDTPFNFALSQECNTSAGIYKQDGTLVRTLWSGRHYAAGSYTERWDGTDDEGAIVADGDYKVKVLSNNVSYTWEGVIGNNSTNLTGPTVMKGFLPVSGLAITGSKAYYTTQYSEGGSTLHWFDTSTPHQKGGSALQVGNMATRLTTDGNMVYWAYRLVSTEPNSTSFVFATKVSDNSEVSFGANGQKITRAWGYPYNSAINVITDTAGTNTPGGIAVQKTQNKLFVAYPDLNKIYVVDKTTGADIRALDFSKPTAVATDTTDNLWVAYRDANSEKIVEKFQVNNDGTLQSLLKISQTFQNPLALAVSPDGSTLLVADGGSSQQVKSFNTSTGTQGWIYGIEGGYASDPIVLDNKLMFGGRQGGKILPENSYIAFQPDGSFWVGDPGNWRMLHLSSGILPQVIDYIMYGPCSYSCVVDVNNPTRVFSNYMEFSVDYSKPLAPDNGSWKLVRNWNLTIPDGYGTNSYTILKCLTTLNNGHTYAFVDNDSKKTCVFELTSDGKMRNTGIDVTGYTMNPDGTLIKVTKGTPYTWSKRTLTTFDMNCNPVWSSDVTIVSMSKNDETQPFYQGNSIKLNSPMTSTGILVSLNESRNNNSTSDDLCMHLGGIIPGQNKWLWQTSPATSKIYTGAFPDDGAYDIGNGVEYTASKPVTLGRNIVYQYHGEFWKNSHTNKFLHFYDDGLYVGQCGAVGAGAGADAGENPAQMAGNGFSINFVSLSNPDEAYIYQNDEGVHSGVHRWKVQGLNSINEQQIDIILANNLQNGLKCEYFGSADWDSAALQEISTANPVSLENLPVVPVDPYSVRWSGYVAPQYSGTYTFKVETDGFVKLWVNGKPILSGTGMQTGTVDLESGCRYKIRVEFCKQNGTGSSIALKWSSPSLAEQVIPNEVLYTWPVNTTLPATIDLLDGLPYANILQDGQYGWKRSPVEENDTDIRNMWAIKTNTWNYKRDMPREIFVNATYRPDPSVVKVLSRSLGTPKTGITSWTMKANIRFENWVSRGNSTSDIEYYGQYLEVLDDNQKVISRFCIKYDTVAPNNKVYSNNSVIYSAAGGLQLSADSIFSQWNLLQISAANGQITFNYMGHETTVSVMDSTSVWNRPKTVRVYFFNAKRQSTYVVSGEMALDALTFTAQ